MILLESKNFNTKTGHDVYRKSNIELLRIISMIIIIAHHYAVHGGFNFSTQNITINRLWIQFLTLGGEDWC